MARRFTAEWWTGVLVLAVLGWHVAFPVLCFAGEPPVRDLGEDLPAMNLVKGQGKSGWSKDQTRPADFYVVNSSVPAIVSTTISPNLKPVATTALLRLATQTTLARGERANTSWTARSSVSSTCFTSALLDSPP